MHLHRVVDQLRERLVPFAQSALLADGRQHLPRLCVAGIQRHQPFQAHMRLLEPPQFEGRGTGNQ